MSGIPLYELKDLLIFIFLCGVFGIPIYKKIVSYYPYKLRFFTKKMIFLCSNAISGFAIPMIFYPFPRMPFQDEPNVTYEELSRNVTRGTIVLLALLVWIYVMETIYCKILGHIYLFIARYCKIRGTDTVPTFLWREKEDWEIIGKELISMKKPKDSEYVEKKPLINPDELNRH